MRVIHAAFVILFIGAVAIFCLQNLHTVAVAYLGWSISVPLPVLIVLIYLLGTFTGWAVISLLRRSLHRATEEGKR